MYKLGSEIRPGDVIMFLGHAHTVEGIRPYEHPTVDGACGIAISAAGWGMTLFRDTVLEVAPVSNTG